jgi:prolyl oligopeptidase
MRTAILAGVLLIGLQNTAAAQVKYPATRKTDVTENYHGTRVADPYRWLEDTNSPATANWVKAQNEVTFAYLGKLDKRKELTARLTELWNYPKYDVPFKEGGKYFYFYNTGLQNQSVLFVQNSANGDARTLLDANKLATDGTVALNTWAASPDGRFLAYATASSGSDWSEIFVRDVNTGKDLGDRVRWVKFSGISWVKDGGGFFYSRYPTPDAKGRLLAENKDQALYYHKIGTPQAQDRLVFKPANRSWFVNGDVTEDRRYLMLSISESTDPTNRLYYIDLGKGEASSERVVKLLDAYDAQYTVIGSEGSKLFVLTNKDAPKRRIVSINTENPAPSEWQVIVPEAQEVIQTATVIGRRIVVHYLKDARSVLRVYTPDGKKQPDVPLPGIGSVSGFSGKPDSPELFYGFTTFLSPTTVYRYDLATRKNEPYSVSKVGFDPDRFETKQVFYTSKDGTRIPMFITARKGLKLDGNNPTWIYAYGGFDISITPYFTVPTMVWLEQGGVFAVPNLRGGGEYGEAWHKAGTKERKQNVFDDFIAAAEYLVRAKYTSPDKLVMEGASNGGLLIGATMTQRPDLYAVAFPEVGVMDMLRFHKFTIGWAWTSDYGSSDNAADFKYLYAYSPLHNIKPNTCYPATMVTTADHDDRVVPGHSFKFAATLQAAQSCPRPALIRIQTKAGHGAGKPTSKQIEEAADKLAFALANLRATKAAK